MSAICRLDRKTLSHTARIAARAILRALMLAAVMTSSVFGSSFTAVWEGGTGNWTEFNWLCSSGGMCIPGSPPGGGVTIGTTFGTQQVPGTVYMNTSPKLAGLALGEGAFGQLVVDGGKTLAASNAVIVGVSNAGVLNINPSGVVTDVNGAIASLTTAVGTATLGGAGAQWNNSNDLSVGLNGRGTLTISGGAHATDAIGFIGANTGSSGTVMVTGPGSRWNSPGSLSIGGVSNSLQDGGGQGALTIAQGGVVDVKGNGTMGSGWAFIGSGGSGTATVKGSNSQLNALQVYVGYGGQGVLSIENGGVVNGPQTASVGNSFGGTGTVNVSGPGSELNSQVVAVFGQSTLTVTNGGAVNAESVGIGQQGVSGGQGTLLVEAGGVVTGTSSGANFIGLGTKGSATITGSGSEWNVGSGGGGFGLVVGAGTTTGNGDGNLLIENGGVVNSVGVAYVGESYVGSGSGTVMVTGSSSAWNNTTALDIGTDGKGTVTVTDGGTVAAPAITIGTQGTANAKGGTLQGTVINNGVLDPLGTATISGNYTQDINGTLILDVAGTGTGDFGKLDVTGNSTFDGTIDLNFINGFAPKMGDSFDFIDVLGSSDFSSATIDIGGLKPGFDYSNTVQNGKFILTALNNAVSATATPEPSTLVLFATAMMILWLYRRRVVQ